VTAWLHEGRVDIALTEFPVRDPDLQAGPVLVREARMLAVATDHPWGRLAAVPVADLARMPVIQLPPGVSEAARRERTPPDRTAGRPNQRIPSAATLQEALMLVGAGRGVLPVGAHVRRYYARPDVNYLIVRDAPPVEWGLTWHRDRATARTLAFARAAEDLPNEGA